MMTYSRQNHNRKKILKSQGIARKHFDEKASLLGYDEIIHDYGVFSFRWSYKNYN